MSPRHVATAALLVAACASPPPPPKQAWAAPAAARAPVAPPPAPLDPEVPWRPTPPPPPLPVPAVAQARVSEAALPTGLRIVVVEHHRRPVVSIRLVLARGARYNPPGAAGATYLAAQLATDFREGDDRGVVDIEEKSFRRQLADLGAAGWADVAADGTLFAVDGYAADLQVLLERLAEAMITPRCGEESFAGRRDGMLDALEDVESGDPEALERVIEEAAFGPGHPYARPVVGTKRSLEPLGLEEVRARQKELLVPRGATLLVVGDVRADRALVLARGAFGKWDAEPDLDVDVDLVAKSEAPPPPARPGGARGVAFLKRKPASTLLVCTTRPLGDVRATDAALEVFGEVLGGGYSSRLHDALREQRQLTYAATGGVVFRRHARALLACAPLAAARAEEGVRVFREVLAGLRAAPPGEAELARAKARVTARLETAVEDVASTTSTWVDALLRGLRRPRVAEDRAAVARVTAVEVQAIARTALAPATLAWVVSGDPAPAARATAAAGLGGLVPYAPRD